MANYLDPEKQKSRRPAYTLDTLHDRDKQVHLNFKLDRNNLHIYYIYCSCNLLLNYRLFQEEKVSLLKTLTDFVFVSIRQEERESKIRSQILTESVTHSQVTAQAQMSKNVDSNLF